MIKSITIRVNDENLTFHAINPYQWVATKPGEFYPICTTVNLDGSIDFTSDNIYVLRRQPELRTTYFVEQINTVLGTKYKPSDFVGS